MPGPWKWYATTLGYRDEYAFESDTREEAIAEILKEVGPFDKVEICEARMSSARKYEGADFVPFVAVRNHEVIDLGLRLADQLEPRP